MHTAWQEGPLGMEGHTGPPRTGIYSHSRQCCICGRRRNRLSPPPSLPCRKCRSSWARCPSCRAGERMGSRQAQRSAAGGTCKLGEAAHNTTTSMPHPLTRSIGTRCTPCVRTACTAPCRCPRNTHLHTRRRASRNQRMAAGRGRAWPQGSSPWGKRHCMTRSLRIPEHMPCRHSQT